MDCRQQHLILKEESSDEKVKSLGIRCQARQHRYNRSHRHPPRPRASS
jgi:hypothetical protein